MNPPDPSGPPSNEAVAIALDVAGTHQTTHCPTPWATEKACVCGLDKRRDRIARALDAFAASRTPATPPPPADATPHGSMCSFAPGDCVLTEAEAVEWFQQGMTFHDVAVRMGFADWKEASRVLENRIRSAVIRMREQGGRVVWAEVGRVISGAHADGPCCACVGVLDTMWKHAGSPDGRLPPPAPPPGGVPAVSPADPLDVRAVEVESVEVWLPVVNLPPACRDDIRSLIAECRRLREALAEKSADRDTERFHRLKAEARCAELEKALLEVLPMCWPCRDTPGLAWGKPCPGCSRARTLLEAGR